MICQEINIALTSKRPIQVNLEQCNVDLSFSRGTEGTWAYRSIIHCASVVQFCYSGEDQNSEKWKQLVEYHLKWMRYKPRSFEPLYRYHNSSSKIPDIVYMGDAHGKHIPALNTEYKAGLSAFQSHRSPTSYSCQDSSYSI